MSDEVALTKQQIANYLNEIVNFRFNIHDDCLLNYDRQTTVTFDELERITDKNLQYWEKIDDKCIFYSEWKKIKEWITEFRRYLNEQSDLEGYSIRQKIRTSNVIYDCQEVENISTYRISIYAPITLDSNFNEIRRFLNFYHQLPNVDIREGVLKFIDLYKDKYTVGHYFSSNERSKYYAAYYFLKQDLKGLEIPADALKSEVIDPLNNELNELRREMDTQFSEITSLSDRNRKAISEQYNKALSNLSSLEKDTYVWQKIKEEEINKLEKLYEVKLSLEAPEALWKQRAKEIKESARWWVALLIIVSLSLIVAGANLVQKLHEFPLDKALQLPYISTSFILVAVISFLLYIIRVLIKLILSSNHLAVEYQQKAALTRFYQALKKSGVEIDKDERLIIISSLFGRIDSGLVKADSSSDIEGVLAAIMTKKQS